MAPINKIFKTGYVFGASTNPITSVRAGGVKQPAAAPVQNLNRFAALNALDTTYGQSPVVDDMTGGLAGGAILRHIAYA